MQQKSHEILSSKCAEEAEADTEGEGHERQARRLLEEALTADWPRQDHHHHHHHHHHHELPVRTLPYDTYFKKSDYLLL